MRAKIGFNELERVATDTSEQNNLYVTLTNRKYRVNEEARVTSITPFMYRSVVIKFEYSDGHEASVITARGCITSGRVQVSRQEVIKQRRGRGE